MNFRDFKAYFSVEYRGNSKYGACLHIFPKTVFTEEHWDAITKALLCKDFDFYTNTKNSAEVVKIFCSLSDSDYRTDDYEDVLVRLCNALNRVPGIEHIIINDGSDAAYEMPDMEAFDWDDSLGLKKLSLRYPVHAEGMEGECFTYSVYFETIAGEQERTAVINAIKTYDFNLSGDDYIGYIDVTMKDGKVEIYLDLGNTQPENEEKIIHGILLALNALEGIHRVIVNEGYDDFV